jgi:hypothetical protein
VVHEFLAAEVSFLPLATITRAGITGAGITGAGSTAVKLQRIPVSSHEQTDMATRDQLLGDLLFRSAKLFFGSEKS